MILRIPTLLFMIYLVAACSLDKLEDPKPTEECPDSVSFSSDQEMCQAPCTITFTNTTSSPNLFDFEWFVNNESQSQELNLGVFNFETAGNYEIKLVGKCNFSQLEITKNLTIVVDSQQTTSPTANFEISSSTNNGYAPSTFIFQNLSTDATSYEWNFGDPTSQKNTSNEESPAHLFENPGIFNVTLIASNDDLSDTITESIEVKEPITFLREYGGGNEEEGFSAIQLKNGTYAIVGFTRSFTNGGRDGYLLLLDEVGNVIREHNYGGNDDEEISDLIEMENGDLMLVGYTQTYGNPSGNDNEQGYIVITNPQGFQINEEPILIGKERGDELKAIIQVNTGYAIVGFGRETGEGSASYLLTIVDELGIPITGFNNSKYFGIPQENDVAQDVLGSGNEIIIIGYSYTYGGKGYMVRTTLNGQEQSTPGSLVFEEVTELVSIAEVDNGFALLGNSEEGSYVYITDNLGSNTIAPIALSTNVGSLSGRSITGVDQNRLVAVGINSTSTDNLAFITMFDISESRQIFMEKMYGANEAKASANHVIATKDGGFLIVGRSQSEDLQGQVLIIKTNHLGKVL